MISETISSSLRLGMREPSTGLEGHEMFDSQAAQGSIRPHEEEAKGGPEPMPQGLPDIKIDFSPPKPVLKQIQGPSSCLLYTSDAADE